MRLLTLLFCCCLAMSFLYFDRNSRSSFTARLENGQEEEASVEDEVAATNDRPLFPSPSRDSDCNDESSFGLSSSVISLTDHEVVVGFPPGTLLEIYRQGQQQGDEEDESHGATILSSAPSNDGFFPPNPRESQQHVISPVAPLPPLPVDSVLSLSTTESEWRCLENSGTAPAEDPSTRSSTSELSFSPISLPSLPSTVFHSISDQSSSNNNDAMVLHEGTAFRNVANRLALEQGGEWFTRFTEQDWINFRIQADAILQALEPTPYAPYPTLVLPPPVPTFALENADSKPPNAIDDCLYTDCLPEEFLCSLCHDPIVGAMTLSCACKKSTVCTQCWEEYSTVIVESEDLVQVERRFDCPCCHGHVQSTVPCHAMDMAIFHAVKNIPMSLQHAYYARLDSWRREVIARRSTQESCRETHRQDLLLAELIQGEEEIFWNKQPRNNAYFARSQRALLVLGEITMCVAVASLSAFGITALASKRS